MQDYIPLSGAKSGALDINATLKSFEIKQYDNNSRKIYISLRDIDNPNEQTVNLENHTVRAYFKLPDGGMEYVDGEVIDSDEGTLAVTIPNSVTQQVGVVECEIGISGVDDGSFISLRICRFSVTKSIRDDAAIEATEQFSALQNALNKVDGFDAELDAINERIDNIEPTKRKTSYYNSVLDLINAEDLIPDMIAKTLGYYSANDGGGSTYLIREKLDADIDDGGSVIILGSDYIAELVTNNKEINVLQFGAVGDGVTDDTRAIQNAMNYANVLSFVPKDTEYLIESSVISNKRITINGNGAKIRSSSIDGEQGAKRLFVFNNGCHVSDLSFYSTNDQKIEVSFRDGNVWDETHGYSSNVIALTLYNGDNSTIRNINTYEINCPVSVGILDGETIKHIVIENVVAYDCVFGINFTNVEDIKISKCYITLDKTLGSGTPHCYYTWGGVNGVFISDCTAISYGNVISLIRFRDTSGLEDISYNRNININNVVCIIPEGSSSVGLEFLGGFDRANINGYYQKNGVALTQCMGGAGDVTVNNFKWDINSVITINTWGTIIRPTANDSHSGISLFSNGVINDNNVLSEESETPYFIILGNGKAYFENVDFNLKRSYAQSTGNYFVFKNCNIVCDYRFDFRPTNDTYIDVIGCYVKELSKENATRLNSVFSYSTEGNTVRVISSLCENYVDDNLAPSGGTVIMYNSTILERTS